MTSQVDADPRRDDADPTTDDGASTGDVPDTTSGPARTWRSTAPTVLAIVLAAVAVIALYGWWQASGGAAARDEVATVAGRAVSALTTWDAADLAPVEAAVEEFGTGRFQDEARGIFGQFATGLEQAGVTSEGEVLDLAVSELGDERAVALATVRQRVVNRSTGQAPVESCWGARVALTLVNGDWLVDRVALFGPNDCDDGGTSPG